MAGDAVTDILDYSLRCCDMVRAPADAPALTADTSVLTAIGNDGYDRLFERRILSLGCPGDVFIAISTSGRSPDIALAIDAAPGKVDRDRRLHRQAGRGDAVPLRFVPEGALGFEAAGPADPYNGRANRLQPCRAVPTTSRLI